MDVLAQELDRLGSVVAKAADERIAGSDPGHRRQRQRACRAGEGAAREHLRPLGDQAPFLAQRRAARTSLLDVGLTSITWVGSELETHAPSVGSAPTEAATEEGPWATS